MAIGGGVVPSGPHIGEVYYNSSSCRPNVWNGNRWVPFGGVAVLKDNLPTLMVGSADSEGLIVHVNGVPITGILDMTIEPDRSFGYARCRLEFLCRITQGLTPEEKAATARGLREILTSLES